MKKLPVFILLLLLVSSCSKKDDGNPADGDDNTATGFMLSSVNGTPWSADKIEVTKQSGSTFYTGTKNITHGTSELTIRLTNISIPGSFGIGENEPGITYGVRGTYTIKHTDGSPEQLFTAYYKDVSELNINTIDGTSIDADFTIFLYNDSGTDSLLITGGRMKLEY